MQAELMRSNERVTIYVNHSHLMHYKSENDLDLAAQIIDNNLRFEPALQAAVVRFMTKFQPRYVEKV